MPIYTYECPVCEERWDERRSFTDDTTDWSERTCEHLNGVIKGRRVWNPGNMRPVLKGKGWPRKDHKDASKP